MALSTWALVIISFLTPIWRATTKEIKQAVGIDYKALPKDVGPGDILLLDDGRIQLKVDHVDGNKVHTTVTVGGKLSNNKGINRLGGGLSAEALTDKDKTRYPSQPPKLAWTTWQSRFLAMETILRYARELAEKAGCNAANLCQSGTRRSRSE